MAAETRRFAPAVFRLCARHWLSRGAGRSWALLGLSLALMLVQLRVNVWLTAWPNGFYTALQHRDRPAFVRDLFIYVGLATVWVGNGQLTGLVQAAVRLRWRRALTLDLTRAWLSHRNVVDRREPVDNPDQRIAQDVDLFTQQTLSLTLGLVGTAASLATFSVILVKLSGSLQLGEVTVPAYMLVLAAAYTAAGTLITHLLGRRLVGLDFAVQRTEADLRFKLVRLRLDAGEPSAEAESIDVPASLAAVLDTTWRTLRRTAGLGWFIQTYGQFATLIAYAAVTPQYFGGAMTLGQVMQINATFIGVQGLMGWFMNQYATLANWRASAERLLAMGRVVSLGIASPV